jgi:bacterioferritin-associated ferredoxin
VHKRSSAQVKKAGTRRGNPRTGALGHSSTGARPSFSVVCRCEEVNEDEIRAVIRKGYHTLEEVKRILRTGMGHCQGRGCLRIIARMIQEETGIPASSQKLPFPRPPLKPLPLGLLGAFRSDESDSSDMTAT